MEWLNDIPDQQRTRLAHNLLNQLTVIVICCDLLAEDGLNDPNTPARLRSIRAAAESAARELTSHERGEEALDRASVLTTKMPS